MILTLGMAHPRTLIRQAVVAQLLSVTAAGARVYDSKISPARKGDLPGIVVYTPSEAVDVDTERSPRELERSCDLKIAGLVRGADEAEVSLAMDDLALQIETAMDSDPYLNGAAGDSVLAGTDTEIGVDNGRSDPLVGIVELTYAVTYRTTPAEPTAADDFLTVDAKQKVVGGVSDTVQIEDQFTVQEIAP